MVKNEYKKHYDITIVGGGLAGRLMLAVLINCGVFDENKFTLEFNTVVHTNNWQGLEDLYNFCTRHDAKWYVNCLTYPHNLSINQLSFYKKRKLRNLLKEVDVPNKDFILAHLDTKPIA